MEVDISPEGKRWLLEKAGVDPMTGARPLRRIIQRHIQDTISELMISGGEEMVGRIEVRLEGDELQFTPRERESLVGEDS
jgi:ATP-dependent Clp protease ATP-binding subunit ClpA